MKMYSKRSAVVTAALLLALGLFALGGCEKEELAEPSLCLVPQSEDPETVRADQCPFRFSVLGGETFFVVHELPDGVALDEDLKITVETPCGREVYTRRHADGRVQLPVVAPPGAGCSLAVTATIANSTVRVTALPVPPLCDEMERRCPTEEESPDAGQPVGEGEGEGEGVDAG